MNRSAVLGILSGLAILAFVPMAIWLDQDRGTHADVPAVTAHATARAVRDASYIAAQKDIHVTGSLTWKPFTEQCFAILDLPTSAALFIKLDMAVCEKEIR